jgi:serine/threonine-protein kinase
MSEAPWRVGERYELFSRLAVSPTCTVWRARDTLGGGEFAVKVLSLELVADPAAVAQLRQTLGVVAALRHPQIAAVDETVTHDGWVALVGTFVPGPSLRALLDERGVLPAPQVAALGAQVSSALAAAHGVRVAHGNLTAAQVLLRSGGGATADAVLTDFGLAALINHAARSGATSLVPAARDRAPELRPEDPGTPAGDVYGLGILLYEALAGQHPFDISRDGDPVLVRRDVPEPIAGLAPPLWRLVSGCLSPNPLNRPTAATAARQLAAFASSSAALAAPQTGTASAAIVPMPREPAMPDVRRPTTPAFPPTKAGAPALVRQKTGARGVATAETAEETAVDSQDSPTIFMPVIRADGSPMSAAGADGGRGRRPAAQGDDEGSGSGPSRMRLRLVLSGVGLCVAVVASVLAFSGGRSGGGRGIPAAAGDVPVAVASGGGTVPGAGSVGSPSAGQARASGSSSASATASDSASASGSASAAPSASPGARTGPSGAAPSASASPSAPPSSPAASSAAPGTSLVNQKTGECLDTKGGTPANGAAEQLATCGAAAGESWTLSSGGALTQEGGVFCLDDPSFGTAPGTRVLLWSCNGGNNQQWTIDSNGSIMNVYARLCLDYSTDEPSNGAPVVLNNCSRHPNQRWSWQ